MDTHILLYIGIGVFFLFIAFIPSWGTIREIVMIKRTPTSSIGSLPSDGQVEIIGKSPYNITRSLLTHSDCVLWQVEILESQAPSRHPKSPVVFSRISEQPFEIRDGTGIIQVDPNGAKVVLRDKFQKESSMLNPLNPHIRRMVRELGIKTETGLGLNRVLQIYERVIRKEKPIYILGHVGIRGGHRMITSKAGSPMVISDRSERALLSTFYSRIGLNLLVILILAIILTLLVNF
jgi:hypothetical protein